MCCCQAKTQAARPCGPGCLVVTRIGPRPAVPVPVRRSSARLSLEIGVSGLEGWVSLCWETASAGATFRDEELSPNEMPGSRLADRTVSVTVVRFESVRLDYLPAKS